MERECVSSSLLRYLCSLIYESLYRRHFSAFPFCDDALTALFAFLHHVGEAVHFHAFTHHGSADDWKASTSRLGCFTKRQTPKSTCQLTPQLCNPRSHLPPLPPDCHTFGFPILGRPIQLPKITFWAVSLTPPLLHFHQLSSL